MIKQIFRCIFIQHKVLVFTYSISYSMWLVDCSKQVLVICLIYLNTSSIHLKSMLFSLKKKKNQTNIET